MKWFLLYTLLLMFASSSAIFSTAAQDDQILLSDDPPYPCPYTQGAYFREGVFPRLDASSGELALIDPATNAPVLTLDTVSEFVRLVNWSPDCRYLSGAMGNTRATFPDEEWLDDEDYVSWRWNERKIVLWDAANGGRVNASTILAGISITSLHP